MKRIITLLNCLKPTMKNKHHKQLQIVVYTLLVMVGRKTTLGLSRWSGKGGSVRTLTRFFESSLDWGAMNWQIIKSHLSKKGKVYLLGGDEVIVSTCVKCHWLAFLNQEKKLMELISFTHQFKIK